MRRPWSCRRNGDSMRYRCDNSDENIRNPNVPPRRVVGGNPGEIGDPRRILQEAMARHNVDKNPVDFEAHYNLGAMLQGRGDLSGAEKQCAIALSIRPEDVTVNNAIAGANLAAGHPDVGVTYLQTALRSRPDYFDAHYNLGTADHAE